MTSESERLDALRELLPATGAAIYLDTATRGPLPAETATQMRQADDWELAVGRAWAGREEDVEQRAEEARAVLAALIGADPDAVTLAHGAADALAAAQAAFGADAAVVAHVDPMTGATADLAGLNRPVILDASLSAGAIPLAVDALGVDAVVLAADRWLLGPEGTGALWLAGRSTNVAPRLLGRTALLGLARSVGWLEMYVGLEWAHERTARLAGRLHGALVASEGVEVLTPPERLAAIVSFRLANWPAEEAADELGRRAHALLRPLPDANALRASVAWFNSEAELDCFSEAVAELGRHTPASLPRRPSIVVLGDGGDR